MFKILSNLGLEGLVEDRSSVLEKAAMDIVTSTITFAIRAAGKPGVVDDGLMLSLLRIEAAINDNIEAGGKFKKSSSQRAEFLRIYKESNARTSAITSEHDPAKKIGLLFETLEFIQGNIRTIMERLREYSDVSSDLQGNIVDSTITFAIRAAGKPGVVDDGLMLSLLRIEAAINDNIEAGGKFKKSSPQRAAFLRIYKESNARTSAITSEHDPVRKIGLLFETLEFIQKNIRTIMSRISSTLKDKEHECEVEKLRRETDMQLQRALLAEAKLVKSGSGSVVNVTPVVIPVGVDMPGSRGSSPQALVVFDKRAVLGVAEGRIRAAWAAEKVKFGSEADGGSRGLVSVLAEYTTRGFYGDVMGGYIGLSTDLGVAPNRDFRTFRSECLKRAPLKAVYSTKKWSELTGLLIEKIADFKAIPKVDVADLKGHFHIMREMEAVLRLRAVVFSIDALSDAETDRDRDKRVAYNQIISGVKDCLMEASGSFEMVMKGVLDDIAAVRELAAKDDLNSADIAGLMKMNLAIFLRVASFKSFLSGSGAVWDIVRDMPDQPVFRGLSKMMSGEWHSNLFLEGGSFDTFSRQLQQLSLQLKDSASLDMDGLVSGFEESFTGDALFADLFFGFAQKLRAEFLGGISGAVAEPGTEISQDVFSLVFEDLRVEGSKVLGLLQSRDVEVSPLRTPVAVSARRRRLMPKGTPKVDPREAAKQAAAKRRRQQAVSRIRGLRAGLGKPSK
jgi:hypothetical protein